MLVVVGLIIAFIIVAFVSANRKTTRNCRWRAETSGDRGALRKYRCAACGEEAFTSKPGPPNKCLAGQVRK